MSVDIGIKETAIKEVAQKLNVFLASSYTLQVKTQNFHWNTEGPHFPMFHAMYEEQYGLLSSSIDEIAERVRVLGVRSAGSMQEFSDLSLIEEAPTEMSERAMIAQLTRDHEVLIKAARDFAGVAAAHDDIGNEDFFVSRVQMHEKIAWMLRATNNEQNM